MRKVTKIALIGATVVGLMGAMAPSAQARGGCVTRSEFRRVRQGMTVQQVKRVYGTGGHVATRSGSFVIRDYNACTPFHVTNVSYWSGRVSGKTYI